MTRGNNKINDPLDSYPIDDHPRSKEPWKQEVAVYKGVEDLLPGEDISKPLPKKEKKEGESEFEHKIRQWTEEVKNKPNRFTGGRKQAIAIAAEQAGVSKGDNMSGSDILKSYIKNNDVMIHGEDKKSDVEGLFDEAKKSDVCRQDLEDLNKNEEECDDEGAEVHKALSSRSMPVLRPTGSYDPFNIYRSATTITTKNFSKLAPDVESTLDNVKENELAKTRGITYKSCGAHGLPYREEHGCNMCKSANSGMCKNCGGMLTKTVGGYKCGVSDE